MIEKYKWSAPKKNNNRAWKRIKAGEWLWDRRRVRRHLDNHYSDEAWISKARGRKGGRSRYVPFRKTALGPDVDMGA